MTRETGAPPSGGHRFIAHVRDDWYPVCRSERLHRSPIAVVLMGTPLAVLRTRDNTPAALVDRCAHRNVPLSLGRIVGERIRCAYHGWEFDSEGQCRAVPGLIGDVRSHERRVAAFAARDSQGFTWVYARENAVPEREPYRFPYAGEAGRTTVREELEVEASLHATAENALDVPHTAFLHGGLFRSASRPRREIEVVVRRFADRVEAEYLGESRPPGRVGKILAPRGGEVVHFDRFILPSIVQVEYRMGPSHLCVTAALVPVEDYRTRLFVVFTYRLPVPGWIVRPLLRPFAMRIFRQDAWMLARQTETIRRFGGESYKFTEIDVLGAEIWDLLSRAERGERSDEVAPVERRIRMGV